MSFFTGDVVAKEQLFGAVGSAYTAAPTVTPPTPGGAVLRRRMRKRRTAKTTLELLRDYLMFKVKQHD